MGAVAKTGAATVAVAVVDTAAVSENVAIDMAVASDIGKRDNNTAMVFRTLQIYKKKYIEKEAVDLIVTALTTTGLIKRIDFITFKKTKAVEPIVLCR